MSCTKLKSAGPALFALFWWLCFREEAGFGSLPVSILLFLCSDRLLRLSVIFRHKGPHLKRLNANLISYMKQSWFIFTKLFFPCLQTTSQHRQPPCTHLLQAGFTSFSIQSEERGSVLWTSAMVLLHLTAPTHTQTHQPPTPIYPWTAFPFPVVDICPQQGLDQAQT